MINILVDGRTCLKGKSPFEGVWYDTHIPYDTHEVKIKRNPDLSKKGYIQEFDYESH